MPQPQWPHHTNRALGQLLTLRIHLQANPAEGAGQIISPFSVATALAMLLNGAEPVSASSEQLRVRILDSAKL